MQKQIEARFYSAGILNCSLIPPSTPKSVPVMKSFSFLARKATARAMSSGRPMRLQGWQTDRTRSTSSLVLLS